MNTSHAAAGFYTAYLAEFTDVRQIQKQAERLYHDYGKENSYVFEMKHKAIIDRFGRYPYRNEILGRPSTAEELEFLQQPGADF